MYDISIELNALTLLWVDTYMHVPIKLAQFYFGLAIKSGSTNTGVATNTGGCSL